MARLSRDNDGNRNGEGPSNNHKPSSKRPRVSTPNSNTQSRPICTAPAAVVLGPPTIVPHPATVVPRPASATVVPRPASATNSDGFSRPIESELESAEETDSTSSDSSSWWGSSSDSESESDHDSTRDGNGACGESVGRIRRGPLSATLTDLDVLDCPICCEPLCSPVYQCENGHIACGSCCTKMTNKCSNCRHPIGIIRCRALEKVLESLTVPCRNIPYGCMETLNYKKKLDHEKTCNLAPCSCPYYNCNYSGMFKCLYTHFAQAHSWSSKQFVFDSVVSISLNFNLMKVFLQERSHSTVFILNRTSKSRGSLVNVVCVAPVSANGSFLYDLTAIIDGDTSIRMKTSVECMPKWTARARSRKCLVLPSDLIDTRRQLKLELIIRRNPTFSSLYFAVD